MDSWIYIDWMQSVNSEHHFRCLNCHRFDQWGLSKDFPLILKVPLLSETTKGPKLVYTAAAPEQKMNKQIVVHSVVK